MPKEDLTSYLAHHGIKGMQWGIRMDRRRSAKEVNNIRSSRPARLDRININTLSDFESSLFFTRLGAQRRLYDIKITPKRTAKAKNFVSSRNAVIDRRTGKRVKGIDAMIEKNTVKFEKTFGPRHRR